MSDQSNCLADELRNFFRCSEPGPPDEIFAPSRPLAGLAILNGLLPDDLVRLDVQESLLPFRRIQVARS